VNLCIHGVQQRYDSRNLMESREGRHIVTLIERMTVGSNRNRCLCEMWFPSIEPLFSPFFFPTSESFYRRPCSVMDQMRFGGRDSIPRILERFNSCRAWCGWWCRCLSIVVCLPLFPHFFLFFSSCNITFDSRRNRTENVE
jgi:hypothetical protein